MKRGKGILKEDRNTLYNKNIRIWSYSIIDL